MGEPGMTVSVLGIEDIARTVLRKAFHFYHDEDTLVLEIAEQSVRIAYSASQVSESPTDLTGIRLSLWFDVQELWIGDLFVSVPFRSKGLGRQLVQAAEMIAHETGIEVVHVFPIHSSQSFWLKLGYVPHRYTARVLSKSCKRSGSAFRFEHGVNVSRILPIEDRRKHDGCI